MSNPKKQRRKHLLRGSTLQQMAAAHAALPLSNDNFQALFDWLDKRLPVERCDHSRRLTSEFLESHALNVDAVLQWLDDNGGFCDCEVLANGSQAWEDCKDFRP